MRILATNLTFAMGLIFWAVSTASAVPFTGNMGPGGVGQLGIASSGPVLWLKADTIGVTPGTKVNTWSDSSTLGNNATADVGSLNTFQTNVRNGFSAVRLPGAVNAREFTVPNINGQTFIAALVEDGDFNCCDGLFGQVGSDSGLRLSNAALPAYQVTGTIGSTAVDVNGTGSASFGAFNTWHTVTALGGLASHSSLGIGQYFSTGDRELHGYLGEAVVYTQAINTAERQIINSYYGAKYNLSITNDRYAGDAPGVDFDRDVFGVGRIDSANQQLNSGAAGFGIQVTGGVAANELNDGEFVLAGHNNATPSILDVSPDPEYAGARWSRIWNVDKNGGSVDAILGFNFANAGLGAFYNPTDQFQLLYSTNAAFNSFEILPLGFTIDGSNTISFNVPSALLLNGFYTLGINVGHVPEPSTGLLLLGGLVGLRRRKR